MHQKNMNVHHVVVMVEPIVNVLKITCLLHAVNEDNPTKPSHPLMSEEDKPNPIELDVFRRVPCSADRLLI